MLALENNYDIAIARINLDIADTDILRAKAGSCAARCFDGHCGEHAGRTTSTITGGGGPGGTTSAAGGGGAGASGLVLSTNGGGPVPELLDPQLTGRWSIDRPTPPNPYTYIGACVYAEHTATYDFSYQEGFVTGTCAECDLRQSAAVRRTARRRPIRHH